jgi:hypothetical protein
MPVQPYHWTIEANTEFAHEAGTLQEITVGGKNLRTNKAVPQRMTDFQN